MKLMESAIADIQLFGSPKQIELAQELAITFGKLRTVSLDPLLIELRHDLRRELQLERVAGKLLFFRWHVTDDDNTTRGPTEKT